MKNRSNRLPVMEPHHDDWVDESWTVDCICGVNFDDGEEMVNCDECGVWVHTRCSRYVKSEKSFACDKCKMKNAGNGGGGGDGGGGVRNDSEETEVAEFLVELPTKTLRMEKNPTPTRMASRGPFRLWTGIPMAERVHVQGMPGGDPGLFSGVQISSVFGPDLWKCAGYVPKKFNFRYAEFPCLDDGKSVDVKDKALDNHNDEGKVNQADNGAGVLFSLSKESRNYLPAPVADFVNAKGPAEAGKSHEVVSPRHVKNMDGKNLDFPCPEGTVKQSRSVKPILLYSGKRKKEELRMSKDQSAKKKARKVEEDGNVERQGSHTSKAVETLTFSRAAKQSDLSQERGSKVVNDKFHRGKVADRSLDGLGRCATNLASNDCGPEATLVENVSRDEIYREANKGDQLPLRFENSSKSHDRVVSLTGRNGSRSIPGKDESRFHRSCGDIRRAADSVGTGSNDKEPVHIVVIGSGSDAKESENGQITKFPEASSPPSKKLKAEVDMGDVNLENMKDTTQHQALSATLSPKDGKVDEKTFVKSEACDTKVHNGSRTDKPHELPSNISQCKQEPSGSEGSTGARKRASGPKHGKELAEELHKSSGAVINNSTASYQRKVVLSVKKAASSLVSNVSKSSDKHIAATAQNPSADSRQKGLSESSSDTLNENPSLETVKDDDKFIRPRKFLKESSRLNSASKVYQSAKSSSTLDAKRLSSDSKNSALNSSRDPLDPSLNATPGFSESSSPLIEGATDVQNKSTASALPGKSEKSYEPGNHSSARGNVASMNSPAQSKVPATLSDEELALLLHQELNSSPRVPRVPRMRSVPQLTGPTATSLLIKRTSSTGGKDQGALSRRKTKDRDGSHGLMEVENEVEMDRKPSPADKRKRDSGVDLVSRRQTDGDLVKGVHSKLTNVTSSLSSSNGATTENVSSSRPSSRNASGDDPRAVSRLTNHTLPGLIAEIMSEVKPTTYEELCNAVLPYWPYLRKHNGERYAYASHSQAVLDCLRNRSEWASLVDRGPKTNASRKRRKTDADSLSNESEEDNEDNRANHAKDVGSKSFESHHDDFPKGKRKARNGRRLALQGRGIIKRRRRADVVSDDEESESFSNSSENNMFSEEEIQGGRTSVIGNEGSASSDEVR